MIVNCFPDERDMYVHSLELAGYDPIELCDPGHAFETAVRLRPSVVITDTMLAGAAGLDLIRSLRRDPRTHEVTIVVVTGEAFPADRQAVELAGGDVVLVKPCLPDDLVSAVDRACSGRQGPLQIAG